MNKTDTEKQKGNHPFTPATYEYEDVSHVFYQFTQWHRSQSITTLGLPYKFQHTDAFQNPAFPKWLTDNNLTLEQYIDDAKKKDLADAKKFLMSFVDRGIKVYVMSWPMDLVAYLEKDDWFNSRLIKFDYKGKNYSSMDSMMSESDDRGNLRNPELTIYTDTDEFDETPTDMHPSKICHRVIADSIIKHLEREI
jgi:hypothetical protein